MSKQNKDKSGNNLLQWVIPVVILIIFLMFTLVNYNTTMKENAKSRAIERVSKQANSLSSFYDGVISSAQNIVTILSNACSNKEDVFDEDNIHVLHSAVESSRLKKGYIVKPDGSAIDSDGNAYAIIDSSEEFQTLLQGVQATLNKLDEDGSYVSMFSAPIRVEGKLLGHVILVYEPCDLVTKAEGSSYTFSLVSSDGFVAEVAGDDNPFFGVGDNVFTALETATISEGTLSTMRQNITNGKAGYIFAKSANSKERYFVYQPLSDYAACIIVGAKATQIDRTILEENAATKSLTSRIMFSIIAFVVILVFVALMNRLNFVKESKELQNKAETDLLTELLNKISTEKKIKEYLQGEGKDKLCMMCVLDVDNFKKINDTMGHAFGDEVLATLGKRIRAEFRVSDIIGRTGGDEFLIFLKDLKDDATILKEAERVDRFFKNFQVGQYTKYSATASVGAAIYPRDATDYETLYKSADTALYKAKKRGKNQLAFYNEEDKNEIKPSV